MGGRQLLAGRDVKIYVRELHGFTLSGREEWHVVPYCRWKPWHWFKVKFTLPTPGAVTERVKERVG